MSTRVLHYLQFFSANLLLARGTRSQAEFARFLGIKNQATYQRYERGENIPNLILGYEIACKIGVTVEDLLTRNIPTGVKEYEQRVQQPQFVREADHRDVAVISKYILQELTPEKALSVLSAARNDSGLSDSAKVMLLFDAMVALISKQEKKQ